MADALDVGTLSAEQGNMLGTESSLSNYAGEYVTDMLGKGQALAEEEYQSYGGPLTAGQSELQTQAFQGIGGLDLPTENMGAFTPQTFTAQNAANYMNPYLMAALNPQIEEARRQSEIERLQNATRMTQAGSFGGSRQAILDSENQRNLQSNLAGITGAGYSNAYDNAMAQFNIEQDRARGAQDDTNKYGLGAIQKLYDMGTAQRSIESEGIAADQAQFKEERDYPYKQVQYMQSLLQGLPIEAQQRSYSGLSDVDEFTKTYGNIAGFFRDLNKATEGTST
tara:strand:- start:189 stop:1031 length:843 start_codon:yes stop_codon:yes gene_type:complete